MPLTHATNRRVPATTKLDYQDLFVQKARRNKSQPVTSFIVLNHSSCWKLVSAVSEYSFQTYL